MMTLKNTEQRVTEKNISLDALVPKEHIIRKIDAAIDFSFIYEKVKPFYSSIGKPSIDPVVLFKIILIQYLFGIRSMRQTIQEIEVNLAYRWFLGYGLEEKIPRSEHTSELQSRQYLVCRLLLEKKKKNKMYILQIATTRYT